MQLTEYCIHLKKYDGKLIALKIMDLQNGIGSCRASERALKDDGKSLLLAQIYCLAAIALWRSRLNRPTFSSGEVTNETWVFSTLLGSNTEVIKRVVKI